MSRAARRTVAAALGVLSLVVGVSSLAWACTPSAYIFLSANSGGAGKTVTVTGKEFAPGPVRIEWTGAPGAQSVHANGPTFSVPVTVPQVKGGGVLYLRATAVDSTGGVQGHATRAFKVTAPASERSPVTTKPRVEPGVPGAPAPRGRSEARSGPQPQRRPASVTPPRPVPTTAPSVTARATAPRTAAAAAAPAQATHRARRRGRAAPSPTVERPQASAVGDLWSRFTFGRKPSLLPTWADPANAESGSTSQLTIGMAFVGAGLVALLAALYAAGLHRRRRAAATRQVRVIRAGIRRSSSAIDQPLRHEEPPVQDPRVLDEEPAVLDLGSLLLEEEADDLLEEADDARPLLKV